jgi:hypothetical protein
MSDTIISSDLQACDDLLCSGESREDFIEANIDRLSIWKDSAEAGDARGQMLYGLCFYYGHGVEEDEDVAIEWIQKSADQGNAQAQCTLGLGYGNGWGVEKNKALSVELFKKAAAQGHSQAIEILPHLAKIELGLESHKVLTKEIAEQFLADEDSVDLSEFTTIEDEAAEVLASSQNKLNLFGLLSLSDQAAEHLAKHNPTGAGSFLSAYATLYLGGGGDDDIEFTANGLSALSRYIGSVQIEFDPLEKQEDAEWDSALAVFNSRQDQRVFKEFTEEMEELLARKDLIKYTRHGEWNEPVYDWCFDEVDGQSASQVIDEFKDLMTTCGNRTIWLGTVESEDDSPPSYAFMGSESEVLERMNMLPDKG